ncbi:MAG: sugar phosphate isomerase/epimerase family protein [Verrucomicrobiota bacterium]
MINPVIMHITYCEQGQTIAETCHKAVAWGFDGVEFRRVSAALKYTHPEKYLDDLAAAKEKSGLKQVIFGYPTADLMPSDASQRAREIEGAISFFKLALKRFPLSVVNAFSGALLAPGVPYVNYQEHGSFIATASQWQQAAEGYKVLGRFAEENKFKFAFETHMGYLHDTPQAAKKLVDLVGSPAVGVNLDYGNTVYFDSKNILPLADTIKHLGASLYYTHLKNSTAITGTDNRRMPAALSQGEINHREYLRALKVSGYKGPICIEAPRAGDREWYAVEDLRYIKSVIADITNEV